MGPCTQKSPVFGIQCSEIDVLRFLIILSLNLWGHGSVCLGLRAWLTCSSAWGGCLAPWCLGHPHPAPAATQSSSNGVGCLVGRKPAHHSRVGARCGHLGGLCRAHAWESQGRTSSSWSPAHPFQVQSASWKEVVIPESRWSAVGSSEKAWWEGEIDCGSRGDCVFIVHWTWRIT